MPKIIGRLGSCRQQSGACPARAVRWGLPRKLIGRRAGLQGLLFALVLLGFGCHESDQDSRDLPAPLQTQFPYELTFQGAQVWEAAGFEINRSGSLHRIVLVGIAAPDVDQASHQNAIDKLRELVGNAQGRAVVQGRDHFQREIAVVMVPANEGQAEREWDVGLQLLELGLAKALEVESPFRQRYQAAQASAQQARRGLWSQ